MKLFKNKSMLLFCALIIILFTGSVSAQDNTGPAISENFEIKDVFEPGIGQSVGEVELVQGKALIIHENEKFAFHAQKTLPLFKGDTITTKEKGLLRFKLNDGSIMTLASGTSLILNRSIYDPDKETRSTFINMGLGKARFTIKKLYNFINSRFKVKTKTAIVGVRGSDFIVASTPESTEVAALDNTNLQVLSLAAPEARTMLKDFENTVIKQGELPSMPENILPDRIEILKEPFRLIPGLDPLTAKLEPPSFDKKGILVSKDELVTPESMKMEEVKNSMELVDRKTNNDIEDNTEERDTEEIIEEQQEKVIEEQQEELRRFEFPAIPE